MKKIFLWILVAFLFITVTGCGSKKTDAIKFKEEYESLNGEKGYGDNVNPEVKISKKNVVKYADADRLIDILDNGTGIIYFGYHARGNEEWRCALTLRTICIRLSKSWEI